MRNIPNEYKIDFKNHSAILENNKMAIEAENRCILIKNLGLAKFIFALLTVLNIALEPARYLWVGFSIAYFLAFLVLKCMPMIAKHINVVSLHYISFTAIFVVGLYVGVITNLTNYTVILPVCFSLMPILVIDTPKRTSLFLASIYLITIFSILAYKGGSSVAVNDCINCTVFYLIGLFLGHIIRGLRLSNIQLQKETQIREYSDFLTGLYNRKKLFEDLKTNPSIRGIAMFDIDDFKKYNDTYGHQKGDVALKSLAKCMLEMADTTVEFYRYGGEEFTALFFGDQLEELALICNKLNNAIKVLNIPHIHYAKRIVTISSGYYFSDDEIKEEQALHYADIALYVAKANGKDRSVHYEESMDSF